MIRGATWRFDREARSQTQRPNVRSADIVLWWSDAGPGERVQSILTIDLTALHPNGIRSWVAAEIYRKRTEWVLETQARTETVFDDAAITLLVEQYAARSLATLADRLDGAVDRLLAVAERGWSDQPEHRLGDPESVTTTPAVERDDPPDAVAFALAVNRANRRLNRLRRTLRLEEWAAGNAMVRADATAFIHERRLVCFAEHVSPNEAKTQWAFDLDWGHDEWTLRATLSQGSAVEPLTTLREATVEKIGTVETFAAVLDSMVPELVTWRPDHE